MAYDSEIQQLLYETITGDSTLMGYIGGTSMVRLEDDVRDAPKFTATKKAFLVIECLPRRAVTGTKNEYSQRALIHVYTPPEERANKEAIIDRLSYLFHDFTDGGPREKRFTTTTYIVFTSDGGVDKNPTAREKQQLIFYVNITYLRK